MIAEKTEHGVTVRAYRGDMMTLLALDIEDNLMTDTFVGFSIGVTTPGNKSYYLFNRLNFDGTDDELPSDKAPFQKFRWIHTPGLNHQELNNPELGHYTYAVTPRYWNTDSNTLKPLDPGLTVKVGIEIDRFEYNGIELGFTRSFLTSQAYDRWFGAENRNFRPAKWYMKDTSDHFCTHNGKDYTFEDAYTWLGYTARKKTLDLLDGILADENKSADVFAYDLNEPRFVRICLDLARAGRIRMILDNSTSTETNKKTGKKTVSGHGTKDSPETWFEQAFNDARTGEAGIWRGRFSRYAHDKVIIVKAGGLPEKVLTGSTNFSVTGFCINANHIAIYNNAEVAALYEEVFETCYGKTDMTKIFKATRYSRDEFHPAAGVIPDTTITFAPHEKDVAIRIIDSIADLISSPAGDGAKSSVLFSVMQIGTDESSGAVYPALRGVQDNESIFSYGITDSTKAISLHKPGSKKGILVNAKDLRASLPPPFNKEASSGIVHNIHHKFVVIDFNKPNARVFFGSSNLAVGGENVNGDNLLCVKDTEIATIFAIQALAIIDHYHFRANKGKAKRTNEPLTLEKDSSWAKPYFDTNDIKFIDRKLFAA
jgi:hypothetical protein